MSSDTLGCFYPVKEKKKVNAKLFSVIKCNTLFLWIELNLVRQKNSGVSPLK